MSSFCLWLALLAADLPRFEVSTLGGESHVGQLESLSTERLTLKKEDATVAIPAQELLELRLSSNTTSVPSPGANILLSLTNGSHLKVGALTGTATQLSVEHALLGPLKIPRDQVASIQFSLDATVSTAWQQLADRERKQDWLVIRKGDVLDHLDGVIQGLDDTTLKFLLDGQEASVKREKVFGLLYARKSQKTPASFVRIELRSGDSVVARGIEWSNDRWNISLDDGQPHALSSEAILSADFSAGRVVSLSSITPRDVTHTPFFGFEWPYQRDRNFEGRAIRVGPRTYPRGLAIHSKTVLRYRLGGDYRRFSAMAGLDPEVTGDARLIIQGDNRILYQGDFATLEQPVPLDLDVTGVIDLEILVDYGRDKWDVGDRVHLGDAKLTK